MVVKSYLRLFYAYIKANLSSAMEYRISFIVQVVGMMLNNACFIVFWWVLFQRFNSIGGYSFTDIMFIWALASSAYGFAFAIFANSRTLTNTIINGELDTYLLQPKDVFFSFIFGRTFVPSWGDLLYGYVLMGVIIKASLIQYLLFTLFIILGGTLITAVVMIAETLTFFLGNNNSLGRSWEELMSTFCIYPDSIFTNWVRWVIYSIMPAGFIVFIPRKIFFGFHWELLIGLVAIDILYIVFAYWFFNKGLKKYESGNLITSRL